MLYPQTNLCRFVLDLNGLWKFRLLRSDEEFTPGMILSEDFEWLAVPASYNDQKENPQFRRFAGLCVYQREAVVPAKFQDSAMILRFDAAANSAVVYINDKELVRHKGGYLPFEAKLNDYVKAGETFTITVVIDNRVNSSTLPVGNDKASTAFFGSDNADVPSVVLGKQYQKDINLPNFDFYNYTGLNRSVRICILPETHIEDIILVPGLEADGTTGLLSYQIKVNADAGNDELNIVLYDRNHQPVAEGKGTNGTLRIPEAHLWWPAPGDPYLYTAAVSYSPAAGEADYYEVATGIRTVRVDGTRFLINEKPFYFKGFGKHEDSAIRGRGFDLCMAVKDVSLIHWLNANSFRTSHYPYAEEMYDLCDREGIVVIDETTAVGIGAGGRNPYEVLNIREHHEDVLTDLIARDKNHPCVVMWSMGNEPDTVSHPQAAYDYWHSLYELAHTLDPADRPVTFVCCQNNYPRDIVTRTMDVVCLNRYYGWYNLSGDLDAAMYAMNLELDFWAEQHKPVMFTEYGADTIAGIHSTVPEMFSEEFQAEFLLKYGEAFDARDYIVGEQMWNFADFGTIQGPMRADGNKKGLFTRDRRPKLAAHAMRMRWKEK